jgi:thiol-disulfide isomerase/thioredoxin
MKKFIFVLFLVLMPHFLSAQLKSGFEIGISIHGLRDSSVYLAYHYGEKQYIKDTLILDKAGHGILQGQESLPQGIYMIVLPGKQYFEILISTDQYFKIDCSYPDYTETLNFTGSDENSAFIVYQRKWMALQKQASSLARRIQNNRQNSDSLSMLTSQQKEMEEKMKLYLKNVISQNNGNLLGTLVKALLPIEVPDIFIPAVTKNPDSVRWVRTFYYNKDHFFDNISFTDERLLRTPILYARLQAFFSYIERFEPPDSIYHEVDKLIKKCEPDYKVFQFVAVYLFNRFRESEIMGHDAVLVRIADDIYLSGKADWVSKEFKDDLRKQIDLIRPNLIGKTAENIVMDSYKGVFVSLDDIDKEFTILYFWEPDCGHCKEATPKLKAFYDKPHEYTYEVFAVCTTSDKPKWTKYIEENKLTWINGWDPERRSHYDFYYNVQSTPTVYILNKNKKIIAKKLSVEEIDSFITSYRKYFK